MMYKYESVIDFEDDVNNNDKKNNKNEITDFYVKNKYLNLIINKFINNPIEIVMGVFIILILIMMIPTVISQLVKVF